MDKRSPIWNYFKICDDETKAMCQLCKTVISRGGASAKSFTTTPLNNHLSYKHPDEYKEVISKSSRLSMSGHHNSSKAKIILCQEWLETLNFEGFLRLFVSLKPRGQHGNFKSQVWNYFGALCLRNYSGVEGGVESGFTVLDENFNYCRLCLAKQQHLLRSDENKWTCTKSMMKCLATSIKCYRTNTATGALSDHLLHDHGLEYHKKSNVEMHSAANPNKNGQKTFSCSNNVTVNQDILLLQEVMAHKPFDLKVGDVHKTWEKIAKSVNATDEDFSLDGPQCLKRVNFLMDLFRQEDMETLRSMSGAEQPYNEREVLLQVLADMEEDRDCAPAPKKIKTEESEVNEDNRGFEGWDVSIDPSWNISLDETQAASGESSDDTIFTSSLKAKKREKNFFSRKNDFVSLSLLKKELEIREQELAFKQDQLELQRQQHQLDRERFAAEQKERELRYEAEREERNARLLLESEERRTLMEILKSALIKP